MGFCEERRVLWKDAVGATFAATATRQTLDPFIQQPMLVVDGKA